MYMLRSTIDDPWLQRGGQKLERPGQFLGADGDQNGRDLPQHGHIRDNNFRVCGY